MQRVAVGKTGQRVMFGEISDAFGLALANRDVAQDRAVLEAFRSLPAREARLDRKRLAVLAPPLELDDTAPPGTSSAWRAASRMANAFARPSADTAQSVSNGRPIISVGI